MSREKVTKTKPSSGGADEQFHASLKQSESPEAACAKIAHLLHVTRNEIALLRLEKGILRFIYPAQLHGAGAIPLSGSAVAARTAVTRTALLSNTFARVKHASLFESVKLRASESSDDADPMPIQKIISVPIASASKVVGVIQISRKALDPSLAGADFTSDDLKMLESAAETLAGLPFMQTDDAAQAAAT